MKVQDKINDTGLGISDDYKDDGFVGLRRQTQKKLVREARYYICVVNAYVFCIYNGSCRWKKPGRS